MSVTLTSRVDRCKFETIMSIVNAAFGTLLGQVRKSQRLTQLDLSDRTGMSRSAIANIERGNQGVTLEAVFAFAEALKVHPTQLIPSVTINDMLRSYGLDEETEAILKNLYDGDSLSGGSNESK